MGYVDCQSFKPWLRRLPILLRLLPLARDLVPGWRRLVWHRSRFLAGSRPEQRGEYDNLAYSCNGCNSVKRDESLPLDPCEDPWGNHLQGIPDGTVGAITEIGQR